MARMRVFAAVLLLVGCQDLHDFQGNWHGVVSADPNLSVGVAQMPEYQTLDLSITYADHTRMTGVINQAPFASFKYASADALAEVRVGGDALRSYFGPAGANLAIVSLFPDQRVEVRLIQGDQLFAVYDLRRQ